MAHMVFDRFWTYVSCKKTVAEECQSRRNRMKHNGQINHLATAGWPIYSQAYLLRLAQETAFVVLMVDLKTCSIHK